jgi:hypothetical protein
VTTSRYSSFILGDETVLNLDGGRAGGMDQTIEHLP